MAAPSRTSQFSKVHKVLKKHYQAVPPDPNRTVFEHLVLACCLENAHYDRAELAYAALSDSGSFFDWNEIRVSTVRELSEAMACLPDPPAAANRVKRVLQSVFESSYSFELEELRKQNLGPAVEYLKKLDGTTNFSVAYVTQVALGGHAIPVDAGVLGALYVVELVTEENARACVVPGLERAIAKNKGIEFGSQLHQFGADFVANPYAPALHQILLQIDPDARQRLPKRRARKRFILPTGEAIRKEGKQPTGKEAEAGAKGRAAKHKRKRARGRKKAEEERPANRNKKANSAEAAPTPEKSDPADEPSTPGAKKTPPAAKKKPTAKKKADAGQGKAAGEPESKASASAGLSKRKPR